MAHLPQGKGVIPLPPFQAWLASNIPAVYDNTMTYYEELCALLKYLEDQVVPALNENAEAITILSNFVEHYFDNLDVQEEINNKLDAMVEDGTMNEIINQEIFSELNARLDLLDTPKVLLIGDSYLAGYNGEENVNSWGYYFKQASGLDNDHCKMLYESGAGFIKTGGSGHTFLTLLQANINSISDKDKYNSVIVGFGLNDPNQGTASEIKTAMSTFITYVKAQFVNAKIYFACVGNSKKNNSTHRTTRQRIIDRCIKAGKQCAEYGVIWMDGVEQVAHDYTLFGSDDIHLSQDGYYELGNAIYEAWKCGTYTYTTSTINSTLTVGGDLANANNDITFATAIYGNTRYIMLNAFNISFDAFTPASNIIKISDALETSLDGFTAFRTILNRCPLINVYFMLTGSDNSTSYHYGYMTINDGGYVEIVTDTGIRNVEIKAIRCWGAVGVAMDTLLS